MSDQPLAVAVFVHEGQLADVFTPGLYMLETNNMPILTTLQHWDHGFKSPFKSEIYFVNTTRFTDLKWGTKNPIMLRDPEFGPTRIRAFGTYVAGDNLTVGLVVFLVLGFWCCSERSTKNEARGHSLCLVPGAWFHQSNWCTTSSARNSDAIHDVSWAKPNSG